MAGNPGDQDLESGKNLFRTCMLAEMRINHEKAAEFVGEDMKIFGEMSFS